jgi:hypothetical protein
MATAEPLTMSWTPIKYRHGDVEMADDLERCYARVFQHNGDWLASVEFFPEGHPERCFLHCNSPAELTSKEECIAWAEHRLLNPPVISWPEELT